MKEIKRVENLARLSGTSIDRTNPHYLHYISYHKELKRVIDLYMTGDLLDIGCGNKPYEQLIHDKVTSYIGCDIVQSDLNKVDIICPANEIPFEAACFDVVMSNQVIEHVEDHQGMVNEAYRLLKRNGTFILSGPFTWPIHEEPYDFFRFSKYGLKYILEKAGFEVVSITPNGGMWANAGLSFIHALQNTEGKTFVMKVIMSLYHRLKLIRTINYVYEKLDSNYFNEFNTINYVVVAKKN